jgi:hypothetical protein
MEATYAFRPAVNSTTLLIIRQAHVHDHARRAKTRGDHDHLVHDRLLPHPAEDARGVPRSSRAGEFRPDPIQLIYLYCRTFNTVAIRNHSHVLYHGPLHHLLSNVYIIRTEIATNADNFFMVLSKLGLITQQTESKGGTISEIDCSKR